MRNTIYLFVFIIIFIGVGTTSLAQGIYTARGYWEESTKKNYLQLKQKQDKGEVLTEDEQSYVQDYETYLTNYFQRLSPEEKERHERMKAQWDQELEKPPVSADVKEFEWRGRDRVINTLYGIYYGSSIVAIAEIDNAAAAGIPLITGGLWLLGPAVNAQKYEGITEGTIRMGNTGKILGLLNGASLGLAIAGDSDDNWKWVLGLSTIGSIAGGEIAFQLHKKNKYTDGYTEMLRHYGFLGPWVGLSITAAADVDNAHVAGLSLLAGSAGGLVIGNKVARSYDYTRGDGDAISSLSLICTGLGFAFVTDAIDNNDATGLFLVPAATSIIGTIWGQRAVRGAYLTKKQGSTINLSTAGSALIGLGIIAMTESESPAVWIGVPSALALVTHQILLNNFKSKNLEAGLRGSRANKNNMNLSVKLTPENYLINKKMGAVEFTPDNFNRFHNPVASIKLTF